MSEKTSSKRFRTWTAVIYPDSAPADWKDILDDKLIPWCCSPLHDKDTNPDDGTLKKSHWHIVLAFSAPHSFSQVVELLSPLNCPIPKNVADLRSMIRYLVHLDHPHKFQYPVSEIECHNGFDSGTAFSASASERHNLISEMMDFCNQNHVIEFSDLCTYALTYRRDDWFPLLCDNSAMVMNLHIKSLRHKEKVN